MLLPYWNSAVERVTYMSEPLSVVLIIEVSCFGSICSNEIWDASAGSTVSRINYRFVSAIHGEGDGTPLQYTCLENPMAGGAWWAAIHGVAQSRTWLKRLSSSSSNMSNTIVWLPQICPISECNIPLYCKLISRKVSLDSSALFYFFL